jgi:hypothetical protein
MLPSAEWRRYHHPHPSQIIHGKTGRRCCCHQARSLRKQFSSTGDVIIGQIHGAGTPASSYPFVMLHAMNDSIVAVVKGDTVGNTGTKRYTLLRNVTLGAKISFSIVDSTNSHIYFSASCTGATGKGSWNTAVPANWKTVLVRFQVGNYLQDHDLSAASSLGSKVNLYSLKVMH